MLCRRSRAISYHVGILQGCSQRFGFLENEHGIDETEEHLYWTFPNILLPLTVVFQVMPSFEADESSRMHRCMPPSTRKPSHRWSHLQISPGLSCPDIG